MSVLALRNLSFSYGARQVFSDVNVAIQQGEMFCLVGPNGCGKSTLLHCLLGHLHPQSGEVLIEGKPLGAYKPRVLAEYLAYVPQNHSRAFPYRVVDVVAMGEMRKFGVFSLKQRNESAARAVLKELGIGHLAEAEYTRLSGGELQMVMLARVICQDSEILVLDEPVSHLDVKRTQRILQLLLYLTKERGKTIIMTTHDFNHPLQFEDAGAKVRMALMENGQISMAASPVALLSSGYLDALYGIKSQLLTIDGKIQRHYLATWSE